MKAALTRIFKLTFGWALVGLGVIGLFLPILQGFLFLMIGFALLSSESAWVKRKVDDVTSRYPSLAAKLRKVKESVSTKRL